MSTYFLVLILVLFLTRISLYSGSTNQHQGAVENTKYDLEYINVPYIDML